VFAGRGLGQTTAAEAKGRLLALPSPPLCCCSISLAVGPEVPLKHRNKQVLPGAGNCSAQKNPETSPTGPDLTFFSFKFGGDFGTSCFQQLCSP